MFDTKKDKSLFIFLLEDFIRETERSLSYFFAVLVFILTFLLTLFGKEAFYTGLIGVFCLFLIKLSDIIDGFREVRSDFLFPESFCIPECRPAGLKKYPDETALTDLAKEFKREIKLADDRSSVRKADIFFYLQTLRETMEDLRSFFPKRPFQPETRQAVLEMTASARKYIIDVLEKKYRLNTEQILRLKDVLSVVPQDSFLLRTQLEAAGLNERGAALTERLFRIIRKIEEYVDENGNPTPAGTAKNG